MAAAVEQTVNKLLTAHIRAGTVTPHTAWYKVALVATKCGVPQTSSIGRRAAENVLHAIRFAGESGRPINWMITIDFATLGIEDGEAHIMFQRVRVLVARWWRYQQRKGRELGRLVDVQSHANPAGRRHVHWLLHLPEHIAAEFTATVAHRLQKLLRLDDLGDALHLKAVGAPGQLGKYVLKGIQPEYGAYLHIVPVNEGIVTGRRTGVSREISRTARLRAGWQRKRRASWNRS